MAEEIEPARSAVTEIVGEGGAREAVRPSAPARPELADPTVVGRTEEVEERSFLLVPLALGVREAGPLHACRLEEARQIVHKAALLLRPFHSHVVVVDAGDGDHVDTAFEQVGNDALVEEIARRLHTILTPPRLAYFAVRR